MKCVAIDRKMINIVRRYILEILGNRYATMQNVRCIFFESRLTPNNRQSNCVKN